MTQLTERLMHRGRVARTSTGYRGRAAFWIFACGLFGLSGTAQAQSDLNLPNTTITSGSSTYQATNSITANNGFTVSGSASVTFLAGSSIVLGPGFQATAGSAAITFQASISAAQTADFSISMTPSSATTITAGGSATYTVTVTPVNSFSGAVSFQASGLLPNGATVSFNPATVTGSGTTQMTVTTSSGGGTGTFAPAVTGTSGSLTHTSSASTLTVNAPAASFGMSVTATSSTTVTAGGSATYAVTVSAINGFSSQVSFQVTSGLPMLAAVSFNPTTVTGSGTSTMTVTTATSTPAGMYSLQVTASGGGVSQVGYATLTVNAGAPDFTVSVGSATTAAGSNAVYTVTVTPLNGFNGTVNYQVSGLPALAGVISYSTQGWQTTMTVGTQSCTPLGTTTPTLTATSGSLIHSYGFGLTVTNPGGGAPVVCAITPTSGQVGTPVTITGVNFGSAQGSSTVTFGGALAAVAVGNWSVSTILTTVPAGATTGSTGVTVVGYAPAYQQFQVTLVGVNVIPPTATLGAGQTQQFSATVTGTSNQQVNWSVSGPGSISATGLYTAPAAVTAQAGLHRNCDQRGLIIGDGECPGHTNPTEYQFSIAELRAGTDGACRDGDGLRKSATERRSAAGRRGHLEWHADAGGAERLDFNANHRAGARFGGHQTNSGQSCCNSRRCG